jgi:hypothetical protein
MAHDPLDPHRYWNLIYEQFPAFVKEKWRTHPVKLVALLASGFLFCSVWVGLSVYGLLKQPSMPLPQVITDSPPASASPPPAVAQQGLPRTDAASTPAAESVAPPAKSTVGQVVAGPGPRDNSPIAANPASPGPRAASPTDNLGVVRQEQGSAETRRDASSTYRSDDAVGQGSPSSYANKQGQVYEAINNWWRGKEARE